MHLCSLRSALSVAFAFILATSLGIGCTTAPAYADNEAESGNTTSTQDKTTDSKDDAALTADQNDATQSSQAGDQSGQKKESSDDSAVPVQRPEKKPIEPGWIQDNDGTWYYFESTNSAPKTGWVNSGGKWYWLAPDENGAMVAADWITDKGKRYYLTDKGPGQMATGWFQVDGDWYYADKSGAQQTGWVKSGNKWYWLQPDQDGKMAADQWIDDGNARYFLTNKGPGEMATGWFQVGNDWYYASNSGVLQTGWVKSGGKWYWLQPDQSGRMAQNQWIIDKGKRYFLTDKGPGQMATGWFMDGNDWYFADNLGAQQTGWVKSGSKWYWLQPDQDGKMAQNQWIIDKGKRYYLTDKGPGEMATGWIELPEGWYYADGNGAQQTGWLKSGNKWYWLQADQNGLMFANGTKEIDGVTYSFDNNGAMAANTLVDLGDGIARYAASSGTIIPIGKYEGSKVILTDNAGQPVSGWIYKEAVKKWFYGEPDTGIMQTGWVQTGGKWYWLDSAGAMATNTWVDGGKYFVGADGAWVQVNIIQDIRPELSHGTKTAQYQKYIVLHDTEGGGDPRNVVNWWISDGRYVAAHFVIGKDGTIVQCVPMDQIAHHAGWGTAGNNAKYGVTDESRDDKRGQQSSSWSNDYGMNSYSIGIELVHQGSTHEGYPQAQLEALDKLIAYIDAYYGKESTIIDHKMWRTGNSDTSKEFAGYLANYRDHRSYK